MSARTASAYFVVRMKSWDPKAKAGSALVEMCIDHPDNGSTQVLSKDEFIVTKAMIEDPQRLGQLVADSKLRMAKAAVGVELKAESPS